MDKGQSLRLEGSLVKAPRWEWRFCQPVSLAASGWSGMQAVGISELLLIVVGCVCPSLGLWGVVWSGVLRVWSRHACV